MPVVNASDGQLDDSEGHSPLRPDCLELVSRIVDALRAEDSPAAASSIAAIDDQLTSLMMFGELLDRYPSPLADQELFGRRRDLGSLVDAMVQTSQATFPFRAPTQALVGRSMNMALINFQRMLWHLSGRLGAAVDGAELRERAARQLRASVHMRLVEEVLADIVTDGTLDRPVRAAGVRKLARLWGDRLSFSVQEFFPVLTETWEARQRVRVIGGSLAGSCEMLQLMLQGADEEFVELLSCRQQGEVEQQAFREFLFGTSSEELDRIARRMAKEGLTSIELDSQLGRSKRDSGSLLFEFFRARLVQCSARRTANLPGPRHTAEGYVMLAWLERHPSTWPDGT